MEKVLIEVVMDGGEFFKFIIEDFRMFQEMLEKNKFFYGKCIIEDRFVIINIRNILNINIC